MYDFANILLSGKCNARCSFCIGRQIDQRLNLANLDEYPPRNLDAFVASIRQEGIRQVVVTGTNTDPQLYRHEGLLLEELRGMLPAGKQISLHTNGRMALRKMEVFNQYDRVTVSLPSFDPETYRKIMGVAGVPDMYHIMKLSCNSIKISCVIVNQNKAEIGDFLEQCRELGVRRVVLRKLYSEKRTWHDLLEPSLQSYNTNGKGIETVRMMLEKLGEQAYRGNPVVELPGMQVTLWDFEQTQSTSLNLFSNGLISSNYLLTKAGEYQHKAYGEDGNFKLAKHPF